jgi:drug/metabolite transporter (DMT)-like permease
MVFAPGAKIRNYLLLFATAVLFSTGGAAIKASAFTSWQVAGFRSGIAALTLYILLPGARRGWSWRTGLIGLAYAAALILFVLANRLTTAANAIFLQSTAPVYLLLLGPLVLREAVRKIDIAVIAGILAGAFLLLSGSESAASAPNPRLGNLVALASGLAWGLTIAGLRWMAKREHQPGSAAATVIVGNLTAFAVCLPMAFPLGSVPLSSVAGLLYLGIFQVALAYICLTRALRYVRGFEAATILLLEPVLNPFWAWAIQGERPSTLAVCGGMAIIFTVFAASWMQNSSVRSVVTRV